MDVQARPAPTLHHRLGATPACTRLVDTGAPIALWLVATERMPGDHALAWLDPRETGRAARFRRVEDVARYLAAHVALRLVVAHHSGIAPAAQRYHRDPAGKWHLADAGWQFSLSYAGTHALIGVDPARAVGVDLECARPIDDADALAALHFDPDEQAAHAARARHEGAAAFLAGWTRKEAALKALGTGLQLAPAAVRVGLDGRRAVAVDGVAMEVGSFRHDRLIAAWARAV